MIVRKQNKSIILENFRHFDLENTFDNGQCFRWNPVSENHYIGVACHNVIHVELIGEDIHLYPVTMKAYRQIWSDYFDLARDYDSIVEELTGIDNHLDTALGFSSGIRMLHQDPWETTISFIISANNNIVRIKRIIETLSKRYGSRIDEEHYDFPTPKQLAGASVEDLRACGLGYRDRYVREVAMRVASGEVNLDEMELMDRQEVEKRLLSLSGVGIKVAQCIMLFGYGIEEVVPADTWIKKIVSILYSEEIGEKQSIESFFQSKFGKNSGYAQQALFHWARKNRLGR